MADFCTIEDVANLLQITIAYDDAACLRAIAEATEAIRNYCHQYIELVEDDEYTFDVEAGRRKLFLPELPVVEVSAVVEDSETLAEGADEDYQAGNYGILYRVDQDWAEGIQIVTVTYSHGYATIPVDVVAVCTRAAARGYQAGLKAAAMGGVAGVTSLGLGDYQVAYGSEGSEGVMGASAARMLLLSEKDMLDRYRYVGQ